MRIVFFLNSLSPHQMPYIMCLPQYEEVDDVYVVVPELVAKRRRQMGWSVDKYINAPNVTVLMDPIEPRIYGILSKPGDTWCIFSGITAFKGVKKWLDFSLNYNVHRAIISEPPFVFSHPLWLHSLRFSLQDKKYTKHIEKFFVMGEDYVEYFKNKSSKWDVIPFQYCTEWVDRTKEPNKFDRLRILYVGSLSKRKNVRLLLNACKEIANVEIGIIGDGEERGKLDDMSHDMLPPVHFYGSLPMNEIPEEMQKYDVLVLPSLYDGWGAVVNEALTLGLYVVCSDKCGAKMLLNNETNGIVFQSDNKNDLYNALNGIKKDWIGDTVSNRIEWSKNNISGMAVAKMFLDGISRVK